MELNKKDLELIAKIDERLKHYKLITDNEQQAPHNWQKQIELNKTPKPLNTTPVEWKVGEWFDANGLFLITGFNSVWVKGDNQDGETGEYHIEAITKPTKEETEQHLVKIAEKKFPVGTKVKSTFSGSIKEITDNSFFLNDDGALHYGVKREDDIEVWSNGKWAKIISEPITEQKERWCPAIGEQYYYITELFTVKSAIRENCMEDELRIVTAMNFFKTLQAATKAAQAIRETLKNL